MHSMTPLQTATRLLSMVWLVAVSGPILGAEPPLQYGAGPAQSSWRAFSAAHRCELVQEIPRYGRAVFSQASGGDFEFALHVLAPPSQPGTATLSVLPPAWRYDAAPRTVGNVDVRPGERPIRMSRGSAFDLYAQLERGLDARFEYEDWAVGKERVSVTLSTVHFRDALPEFLGCTQGLIQLGFTPMAERRVGFATDKAVLSAETAAEVAAMAALWHAQPLPTRIVVAGHADERGSADYNDALSRRRAEAVRAALVKQGVPERLIETRHYGFRWPLDPGSGEAAWSRNRRADIWLTDSAM